MAEEKAMDSRHVKSLREENCDKTSVYVHEILAMALKRLVRARGLNRDQICDMIDQAFPESSLSPENLRHLVTDRAATFTNPLGIVAVLAALGEPEMLARMARHAGYILVPVSEAEGTEADLLASSAAYQGDVGETLMEIAKVLADGAMTPERAATILKEIAEDEQKLAGLKRSVQAAAARKAARNAFDA
jgi:hypothetical protein